MRGVILTTLLCLLFLFWLAAQLNAFRKSESKPLEAKLTVAYIIGYPALVAVLINISPFSAAIILPLAMGGLPWLFAGIHLRKVMEEGYRSNPREFIGISIRYWLGVGLGAFLLGLMLQYLEQL